VGSPELTEKLSSQLGDWEASTVLVRAGQNWAAELFRNGTKPKQLIPQLAALLTGAADEVEAVNLVVEGRLTEPPAAVLFAVNPDEERLFDPVLAPLAERLEAAGIQVVAVERSGQAATLVDRWCRLGVSTIDNAETPVGLVSLALVVQGRTGHFGTSKWAQSLVPDISSPASKRAVGQ
jgi:hypothetical protein